MILETYCFTIDSRTRSMQRLQEHSPPLVKRQARYLHRLKQHTWTIIRRTETTGVRSEPRQRHVRDEAKFFYSLQVPLSAPARHIGSLTAPRALRLPSPSLSS